MITGGAGDDEIYGGDGNNIYYVSSGHDHIYENEGIASIYASRDIDMASIQHLENIYLMSNINATGNILENILVGNDGNNILQGGLGSDTALYTLLNASNGTGGNGHDIWQDFKVGDVNVDLNADKIDISSLLINFNGDYSYSTLENFLTVTTHQSDTRIYVDLDGSDNNFTDSLLLTLKNVNTTLDDLINNNQIIV